MSLLFTSLSEEYQLGAWGLRHAVRELIANALDAETRGEVTGEGKCAVTYNERAETLTIENANTTVPARALLLGASSSREYDECIGRFGEGLPMALLVLARLRAGVQIINGQEKWEPKIVLSPEHETRVLAIQTRKLQTNHNCFRVVLQAVTPEQWTEWRMMFLRFDASLDQQQVLTSPYRYGRVLVQRSHAGRIYVKGVYTHTRTDYEFGYDLDMELGRDREFVNAEQLASNVDALLNACLPAPEPLAEAVTTRLLLTSHREVTTYWSGLRSNTAFLAQLSAMAERQYAMDVQVFTDDHYRLSALERAGVKGAYISPLALRAVGPARSFDRWQAHQNTGIEAVHALETLTEAERGHLQRCLTLFRPYRTSPCQLSVVTFVNPERVTLIGNAEDMRHAYVSRSALADLPSAVAAMTQLFAELETCINSSTVLQEVAAALSKVIMGVAHADGSP
jgi:hypothetical protein